MSESVVLLPEAIRVLGVLLEKEKTTPEYYPMSVNSLIGGCNQKSSRNPVVQYDEATVVSAIEELKKNEVDILVNYMPV
ncbi:MAG: YceH family protein, partial [Flavobacteriales bacterium]|nr:YceH family protein [Flavobacteriales bacterium]